MRGLFFNARETVATDTPNSRAISFMVMDMASGIFYTFAKI